MSRTAFAAGLAAVLLTAGPGPAAEPTVSGLRLGEPIVGTKPTPDDLKGKVVVAQFWGKN